jgi:hypothetical protein
MNRMFCIFISVWSTPLKRIVVELCILRSIIGYEIQQKPLQYKYPLRVKLEYK